MMLGFSNPIDWAPSLQGWHRIENGSLAMKWFGGSQMPDNLQVDIVNGDELSCGYDFDDEMKE